MASGGEEAQLAQCQAYVQRHNVQQLVKDAIVQLCIHKPDNPITFLKEHFEKLEEQHAQVGVFVRVGASGWLVVRLIGGREDWSIRRHRRECDAFVAAVAVGGDGRLIGVVEVAARGVPAAGRSAGWRIDFARGGRPNPAVVSRRTRGVCARAPRPSAAREAPSIGAVWNRPAVVYVHQWRCGGARSGVLSPNFDRRVCLSVDGGPAEHYSCASAPTTLANLQYFSPATALFDYSPSGSRSATCCCCRSPPHHGRRTEHNSTTAPLPQRDPRAPRSKARLLDCCRGERPAFPIEAGKRGTDNAFGANRIPRTTTAMG